MSGAVFGALLIQRLSDALAYLDLGKKKEAKVEAYKALQLATHLEFQVYEGYNVHDNCQRVRLAIQKFYFALDGEKPCKLLFIDALKTINKDMLEQFT